MTLKKIFSIILLLILIGHFSYRVYNYRSNYLIKYDHKFWTNKYLKSQWVVSGSKEGLGDDGLYAYAGYEYIMGKNPILINSEMPPLGKYLIGISILIFKNQAIFAIITGISALALLYLLSFEILKSRFLGLLVVTIFSLEPLFFTQLSAPYLDLLYLTFILAFLMSLFKKNFLLAVVFLGFMAGTKSTLTSFILGILISMSFLILNDKKLIKRFFLYLPVSFIVLLLIYFRYFLSGNSLKDFLGVQKYIYLFYVTGAKGVFGSFIPMLFLGKWFTWWGTVEKVKEWTILWPIISIFSLIRILYLMILKKCGNLLVPFLWLFFYSGFLFFIPVWPRYFLLFLPFLYIIIIDTIKNTLELKP